MDKMMEIIKIRLTLCIEITNILSGIFKTKSLSRYHPNICSPQKILIIFIFCLMSQTIIWM